MDLRIGELSCKQPARLLASWLEWQTEEFYFCGIATVCQKNVANALNSVVIILKNKVQFVTFPFFFIVELQNFLNAPRMFTWNKFLLHNLVDIFDNGPDPTHQRQKLLWPNPTWPVDGHDPCPTLTDWSWWLVNIDLGRKWQRHLRIVNTLMVDSRMRLRSTSSHKLIVRQSRLITAGDRAFGAATPRLWNDLPADVVTLPFLTCFKTFKNALSPQSFDV